MKNYQTKTAKTKINIYMDAGRFGVHAEVIPLPPSPTHHDVRVRVRIRST